MSSIKRIIYADTANDLAAGVFSYSRSETFPYKYRLVEPCVWNEFDDYGFYNYETSCGKEWVFTKGTAQENKCAYCPYCGGKIEVKEVDGE